MMNSKRIIDPKVATMIPLIPCFSRPTFSTDENDLVCFRDWKEVQRKNNMKPKNSEKVQGKIRTSAKGEV